MQAMNAGRGRQLAGIAIGLMFLLAACGETRTVDQSNLTNPTGQPPNRAPLNALLKGKFAAVAADESRAAEVGRDVILEGGNAIDAAVAMYFAQAVTLPSASSLGAAGVCLVHSHGKRTVEMFAFPPMAAPGPIQGTPFLVPLGVRAVTLMHVRHGKARFEQLIAPAERLARFGAPVSRALTRDLQTGAGAIGADGEARRVFSRVGGAPLGEGDNWVQTDLASVLGSLRQTGGVDFFSGRVARLLSDQIGQMGGNMPIGLLRDTVPVSGPPPGETYGGFKVSVAPPPLAGAAALAGWNGQGETGGVSGGDSGGFAGLVALDSEGNAAACTMSMGQVFGAGRVVPGTGVLLGAATPNAASVSPLLISNTTNGEFLFAGAGGGSPTAMSAVGAVARAAVQGRADVTQILSSRGGRGGRVNAFACPRGLRGGVDSCTGGADPAAFGLALPATR